MKHKSHTIFLAVLLILALATPCHAEGLFDWLFGAPEPTAAPAMAEVTQAPMTVTLPPAEALIQTEAPTEAPTASPAPIPDAGISDDGMLRVGLRTLDGTSRLGLTLEGVYAVEGDPGWRFERGAKLTLTASEGSVWLNAGGMIVDMGPSLTLTRHRAEAGETNGIRIAESEKDALYCGDLCVTAEGDALRSVLKLPVEEYLYGVVAYEMSDSFPIEALKAQAVAARTYAMQRKAHAGRKGYDVVDTTADQVFKGYDPSYTNVIRAVDDTRGVVGLYDGSFAICYYTASNGGQTALPSQIWARTDADGYLAMIDDPYDLENPRSLCNDLRVTAACEGSAALKGMLEEALGAQLSKEGWKEGEWALDSIAAIEPIHPRFEGSRMFDDLQFTLRVKLLMSLQTPEPTPSATPEASATPEVSPTPVPSPTAEPTEVPREWRLSDAPRTVTLPVYTQIKDGLSLGLNGGDWELLTVDTESDADGRATAFTLRMRRFGHGVGMSQRGAQWMAGHYGMTWREILAFYYPGLTLARMNWPEAALTDLAALPERVGAARPMPSPTPSPAPLPALREGDRYATVTATSLNVRERPTTAAQAIDQLPKGYRVVAVGTPDADGWIAIRTGELEGFVKAEYLEF